MKQKGKRIRKNIMVTPGLIKRARNILNAASDSQAIEKSLEIATDRKTDDELWKATIDFVKHLKRDKIRPVFN